MPAGFTGIGDREAGSTADAQPRAIPRIGSPRPRERIAQLRDVEQEAPQLGSARYGYTFRRVLFLADVVGLAAAIACADGLLQLAQ